MDDDSIFGFWRDRAKLAVLSPEYRLKTILSVAAAVLGIGLALSMSKWKPLGVDELTMQVFYAIGLLVILPTLLAVEMFYKGGKAAMSVKRECDVELADEKHTLAKVESEFTNYRIAKEQEVKDIERDRGETIAQLQARIAELESKLFSGLTIEPREKWGEDNKTLDVHWLVRNSAPVVAHSVTIVIEDIIINAVENDQRHEAESLIDRLKGLRLRPRTRDSHDDIVVSVPGHATREFFFLSSSTGGSISCINEKCFVHELADGRATEVIQMRIRGLPQGSYRFILILASTNNASTRITCDVVSRGQSKLAFDVREIVKPNQSPISC